MGDNGNSFPLLNVMDFVTVKLNGDNYLIWKHQMVTILKAMGLMQFINSHVPSPARGTREYALWKQKDGYVSICINATLDESVAHLAIGTTSTAQLWKIIEETYLGQVFAKKTQLRSQFYLLKQGNFSVATYCDIAKKLADQLKSIGDSVTDEALVFQVLQGLTSAFNVFVLNFESYVKPLTFPQLRSKLLVYEERLRLIHQKSDTLLFSGMEAFNLHAPYLSSYCVTCQICNINDHDASVCYLRYTGPNTNDGFHGGRNDCGSRRGSEW